MLIYSTFPSIVRETKVKIKHCLRVC